MISRGVAGCYGSVFLEHGRQGFQLLHGHARPEMFILVHHHFLAAFFKGHGNDFILKAAFSGRPLHVVVAAQGGFVLILPSNIIFFGHVLGGDAHEIRSAGM